MRWVAISLVVHAVLIAWLSRRSERLTEWHMPTLPAVAQVDTETFVELVDEPAARSGGGGSPTKTHATSVAARNAPRRSADAWEQIDVHVESTRVADGDGGSGGGDGGGIGGGHGAGVGLGMNGGVQVPDHVPAPPAPPADPPVSKARPAKLIWPTRDEEVDDGANLFVAKVTVDASGDVIGARFLTVRPGAKAEHAANAIWTFRYSPALDDDGVPTRSTFEQSFQVR